nr:MAG TPA: hypothetical protein [Caudoviricetes sp.]
MNSSSSSIYYLYTFIRIIHWLKGYITIFPKMIIEIIKYCVMHHFISIHRFNLLSITLSICNL